MLTVTSTAFTDGGLIPAKYCALGVDGASNLSPGVSWGSLPNGTRSVLVAIVDHHPVAHMWVHWVVTDIAPATAGIAEGASGTLAPPARELQNTSGRLGYSGPRPPIGSGDHDYVLTVYALDVAEVRIPDQPDAAQIDQAVAGHTLAIGSITGVFGR